MVKRIQKEQAYEFFERIARQRFFPGVINLRFG